MVTGGDRRPPGPEDPPTAGRVAVASAPTVEDDRVTVVVASRNRREDLARTLGRHHAPTVLVDNGSGDGTTPMVQARFGHVHTIHLPYNAGAYGRTEGARAARTDFVAFADDDSWWAPGSLKMAADLLVANPRVAAVVARILVGPGGELDPFCRLLASSPLPPASSGHPSLLGFVACATMVRRGAFLDVGGFDDIVRFPGEEERVAYDLVDDGYELIYASEVVVHHHPSPRRSAPRVRVRAVTRSAVLTAILRLPWPTVRQRAALALRGGSPTRLGLWDSARDAVRANRTRRVVGPPVLHRLEMLRNQPA